MFKYETSLTVRQKLVIPFLVFTGMIALGVSSIFKGLAMHQPWRIALALAGIVCFATLLVFLINTLLKQEKVRSK